MTKPMDASEVAPPQESPPGPFALITRKILVWPRATLLLGCLLAIFSLLLTANRLEFRTSREDLINPRSPFQKRWKSYTHEFGATDEVIVLIAGTDRDSIVRAQRRMADELRQLPDLYQDVMERFDAQRLLAKGLYYLPDEQLAGLERATRQLVPLFHAPQMDWTRVAQQFQAGSSQPWPFAGMLEGLRGQFPDELFAQQDRLGMILLRWIQKPQGFVPDQRPWKTLQRIAQRLEQTEPTIQVGITGLPVLEQDEMETSQQDMTWASVLSALGVAALFWAGFGGVRDPMLAMSTLGIGIAWTCGYLTLSVGHLNILSVSFGVILIGLGIDFAIHWVARYRSSRAHYATLDQAMVVTAVELGPPLLTGGVTTALAFFATSWTEFTGVAELGWIAGGGVLLCLLATFTILPAGIACWEQYGWKTATHPLLPLEKAFQPLWNHSLPTVVAVVAVTIYLAMGLPKLKYDFNLLNLQAENLPSVQWEHHLLENTDRSVWYAVSLSRSREEILKRKKQFEQLPSVERVEEIASLLPEISAEKQNLIRAIADNLSHLPKDEPVLRSPTSDSLADRDIRVRQSQLSGDLWRQLQDLRSIAATQPPQLEDIPAPVRKRFIGQTGVFALHVFARGDIWQMEILEPFVRDIKTVDPRVTGQPLQTYFASHQMRNSFVSAGLFAAIAVLIVLTWDLGHPRDVVLAALPTTFGCIQMFGLMGHLGLPLNPANIVVLPLILGIGVDDGVHIIHDWRRTMTRGNSVSHWPDRGTVTGIMLTSLTSMIGFGSLMLAHHRGLWGLGQVATVGILCCLITSLVGLPTLLDILYRGGWVRSLHAIPSSPRPSVLESPEATPRESGSPMNPDEDRWN